MNKPRVQLPSGVSSVSAGGQQYDVGEDGIVTLDHPDHVAPLVQLGGTELGEDGEPGRTAMLIGTSTLPPTVELGEGQEPRQLGDIVKDAHARTNISADEWNNLPQPIRDLLIGFHVDELRGELLRGPEAKALRDQNAELLEKLESLQDTSGERLQQQPGGVGGGEGTGANGDADQKPDFASMTKAQLNDWVTRNGGEEIPASNHDAHVEAAEARWLVLHPAETASE